MKKIFTLISAVAFSGAVMGQTWLAGSSQLVTHAGQGPSGSNVSSTQTSLGATLYGSNQNHGGGFWIASRISVPAGGWMLDSLITYGYQTGSSTVSTFTASYAYICADSSSRPSSTIIVGSNSTNIMTQTSWSGIYRATTDTPPFTETNRPIMRIKSILTGSVSPGNYWVVWDASGSLASGPWCPPVTTLASLSTGTNSYQYNGTGWIQSMDGTSTLDMPFKLYGQGATVTTIKEQSKAISVTVGPNPMSNEATVTINAAGTNLAELSFKVYDQLGREVMNNTSITSSSFTIEKGNLATGNYIYKLSNKKDNSTLKAGKLIIQ